MSRPITDLPNLGPRCAEWLAAIGIHTAEELEQIGAAAAFRELVTRGVAHPHRMLLYAMGGALSNTSCIRMSRTQKRELEEEAGILS